MIDIEVMNILREKKLNKFVEDNVKEAAKRFRDHMIIGIKF